MAPLNLTATLQNFTSAVEASGGLIITLCNYGSNIPRIAGTSVLADPGPREVPAGVGGVVNTTVWGNDVITPNTTYYNVQVMNSNGDVVQCNNYEFTGTGNIDLSTIPPINPSIGVPPFQFATTDAFVITLTGSAPPGTIAVFPGSTYTLTKNPYLGFLLGLYYNGNFLIAGLHYTLSAKTITLTFNTFPGDNLCAVYVAQGN